MKIFIPSLCFVFFSSLSLANNFPSKVTSKTSCTEVQFEELNIKSRHYTWTVSAKCQMNDVSADADTLRESYVELAEQADVHSSREYNGIEYGKGQLLDVTKTLQTNHGQMVVRFNDISATKGDVFVNSVESTKIEKAEGNTSYTKKISETISVKGTRTNSAEIHFRKVTTIKKPRFLPPFSPFKKPAYNGIVEQTKTTLGEHVKFIESKLQ